MAKETYKTRGEGKKTVKNVEGREESTEFEHDEATVGTTTKKQPNKNMGSLNTRELTPTEAGPFIGLPTPGTKSARRKPDNKRKGAKLPDSGSNEGGPARGKEF